MAVRPQTVTPVQPQRRPENKPSGKQQQQSAKSKRSGRIHNNNSTPGTPLPADVQQLKDKILASHPEKLTRFSLSHMRRVAIPPVEIPKKLDGRFVVTTVVSGKTVPLTRRMWENRKKRAHHLDMIDEFVVY
ncbi:hypothetical protein PybrP1_009043 [[Pythium] brassicae (nom. inval.)]|nr:hypothetical protein PybrP1_009043 [[Pythium] brassicae (nom. inval.)]